MPSPEDLEIVAKNILFLRNYYGLTQKQMIKILNISMGSLERIERGFLPLWLYTEICPRVCKHFSLRVREIHKPLEETLY